MNEYIFVFLICVLLLFVLMGIASVSERKNRLHEDESNFRNSDGDHRYYERSLIEKKDFMRQHPEIPDDDLRTLSRLFRRLRLKKK